MIHARNFDDVCDEKMSYFSPNLVQIFDLRKSIILSQKRQKKILTLHHRLAMALLGHMLLLQFAVVVQQFDMLLSSIYLPLHLAARNRNKFSKKSMR